MEVIVGKVDRVIAEIAVGESELGIVMEGVVVGMTLEGVVLGIALRTWFIRRIPYPYKSVLSR